MLLNTLIAALFLAPLAAAQDGGSNTIVENEITVHIVTVGLVGHTFSPNSITANPDDKIMFLFYDGNHSVIESEYGWPCVPREAIDGREGFYSGPQPDANNQKQTVWNYTVDSTESTFFYCGAQGSCINYGMLGVINPDESINLSAQIELAKEARFILYPGETLSPAAATSLSALAEHVLAPSNTTLPEVEPETHHGHELSTGAIVGIAIGGAAFLALLGAVAFYFGRSKGRITALRESLARSKFDTDPAAAAPPEMIVDGVTYVRAEDAGPLSPTPSLQPLHISPMARVRSTEFSVGGLSAPTTGRGAWSPQFDGRASGGEGRGWGEGATLVGSGDYGGYAPPALRYELPVPLAPALLEKGNDDVGKMGC